MNMKVITAVKTKKELTALYLTQYSERRIRTYINDIIAQYRPNEPTKCRNISIHPFPRTTRRTKKPKTKSIIKSPLQYAL